MTDQNRLLDAVILAAGKGVRMNSEVPKVLHRLCGRTLLERVCRAAAELKPLSIVVVVGAGEDLVRKEIEYIQALDCMSGIALRAVRQVEQRGTGDAVLAALPELSPEARHVAILPGDMPLITGQSLNQSLETYGAADLDLLVLSFIPEDPAGFGRVIRAADGSVRAIIEKRDCSPEELQIREVNSSIYFARRDLLETGLGRAMNTDNAQGEFYLTDIVSYAAQHGRRVSGSVVPDPAEVAGVNSRLELANLEKLQRRRIVEGLLASGVAVEDPDNLYVEEDVRIGADSYLGAGTRLYGSSALGHGVIVEGDTVIRSSKIGDGAKIKFGSYIDSSAVGPKCQVGPFAHLRPGSELEDEVKIGNFVETKKAHFGRGAKASHLAYIGDAEVGADVNIGCGTITCNYDGVNKYKTTIGRGAFIGSNTNLVAPVSVGAGSVIGAGSTITKDVPDGALGLERAEQRNIEGWVERKRKKQQARS